MNNADYIYNKNKMICVEDWVDNKDWVYNKNFDLVKDKDIDNKDIENIDNKDIEDVDNIYIKNLTKFAQAFSSDPNKIENISFTPDFNIIENAKLDKNTISAAIEELKKGVEQFKDPEIEFNIKKFKIQILAYSIFKIFQDKSQRDELLESLSIIPLSQEITSKKIINAISDYVNAHIKERIYEIELRNESHAKEKDKNLSQTQIKYLLHTTNFENITNILKMGKFVPSICNLIPWTKVGFGGSAKHGNRFLFMTSLFKFRKEELITAQSEKYLFESQVGLKKAGFSYFPHPVTLVFSKQLLSGRKDFHFSFGQLYGEKIANCSVDGEQIVEKLTKNLNNDKTRKVALTYPNELVFSNEISLFPYLKEIWVLPENRNEFLELLKNNKIVLKNDPEYTLVKAIDNYPDWVAFREDNSSSNLQNPLQKQESGMENCAPVVT